MANEEQARWRGLAGGDPLANVPDHKDGEGAVSAFVARTSGM